MAESWVNFSDPNQDKDVAIFVRPDGLERVHVYVRANGSFGLRNFFRQNVEVAESWEVGQIWGNYYDTVERAISEAVGHFHWLSNFIPGKSR